MRSRPRFVRLFSAHSVIQAAGKKSRSGEPGLAGHWYDLGGTLVATCSLSLWARANSPTSRSEWPSP